MVSPLRSLASLADRAFVPLAIVVFGLGFLAQNVGLVLPARLLNAPQAHFNPLGFTADQFFMNYLDHGFIRRGTFGTLLLPVPEGWLIPVATALSGAITLALIAIVGRQLDALRGRVDRADLALFKLVVLISPLTFSNLGYQIGRYDAYGFLFLALALGLIGRGRRFAAGGVVAFAMLTHEAFVVYGFVPVIGFLLARRGVDIRLRRPGAILRGVARPPVLAMVAIFAGLSLALVTLGNAEIVPSADLLRIPPDSEGTVPSVWSRGTVEASFGHARSESILLLGYLAAILGVLHGFYAVNGLRADLLALSPVACGVLFVVGVDYARWCAITFVVVLVVMRLQCELHGCDRLLGRGALHAAALTLVALPLGPVGDTSFFPVVAQFGQLLGRL